MVQVYFSLVFLNLLGGIVLAQPGWNHSLGIFDRWFEPFENRKVKGILGLVTFLSGFFGLIFVFPGDPIFLGDLLPSLSALLAGTVFIVEFYKKPADDTKTPSPLEDFLVKNRFLVGLAAMLMGFLHFISPGIIFL